MTCHELERWLDDGGAPERHSEAMAHARVCARCSAALAGADAWETQLARPMAAMPPGLTERIMARVATTPQVPARIPAIELLPFFETVPWWVRVAVEPASLLAILLASALLWRGAALFALASGGAAQLAAWTAWALSAPLPIPDPGGLPMWLIEPGVTTGLALAMVPLVIMGSRALYVWSAGLVGPHRGRLRGR